MSGVLWLQAQSPSDPGFGMLVPMALIFVIFYFLLIRPQQKKQRAVEAMLKAIEKGDSVVTSGGLHGRVTGVSDDVLTLDIAVVKGDHVKVKVARSRVENVESAHSDSSKKDSSKKDSSKKDGSKKDTKKKGNS